MAISDAEHDGLPRFSVYASRLVRSMPDDWLPRAGHQAHFRTVQRPCASIIFNLIAARQTQAAGLREP